MPTLPNRRFKIGDRAALHAPNGKHSVHYRYLHITLFNGAEGTVVRQSVTGTVFVDFGELLRAPVEIPEAWLLEMPPLPEPMGAAVKKGPIPSGKTARRGTADVVIDAA